MADAQKTIDLIFNGVDKTGAAVQSVLKNTSNFAGGVQSATQPIADFTFAALKFEAALLATGAAVTAFAVKTAGDFDTGFREIATLLNIPIEELDRFQQAILDYSVGSTASLSDINRAIYSAISLGVEYSDAIDVLTIAEKASVAGRADLDSSLRVIVSSLNAYGLGMDQAERFSDALFTAIKGGDTTLSQLVQSLALVNSTANTLEIPFETVNAAVATLTAQGTPTAQAVTQISAALSALLGPSDGAKALASELGIEFSAQAVKAKGLEVVLQEVQTATGGNEDQMKKLFGSVEALRAIFPLTGASAQKFADELEAQANKAGATQIAYEKMADAIGNSAQKVKNSLDVLLVAIGAPLLDEFGGVAESIAAMFQALGGSVQSSDGLGPLLKYVEQVAQEIEQAFAQVAKNLPDALAGVDTSKAIAGLKSLRDAFGDLFDGMDLSTPEGLAEAIQKAVDAFGNLSEFSAGAIEGLQPLVKIAANLFNNFADMDSATARAAGETAGLTTTVNVLSGVVANFLPSMETLVSLFIGRKIGIGLVGAVKASSVALSGTTGLIALVGKFGLAGAFALAGYGLGTLLNKITEFTTGNSLSTWIVDAKFAFDELVQKGEDLAGIDPAPTGALKLGAAAVGLLVTGYDSLIDKFKETGEASKKLEGALSLPDASREVPRITGGLIDTYGELVDSFLGIGESALTGPLDNYVVALEGVATGSQEAETATRSVEKALLDQGQSVSDVIAIYDEATGKIIGYTDGVSGTDQIMNQVFQSSGKAAGGIRELGKSADEMRELSEAAFLKLEELASNERITNIEARVSLNIAQLEADTQRTLAAFDSISTSINSTGDLLGSLFGQLGSDLDFSSMVKLDKQIAEENRRRDEALGLQRDLTEAQIEALRARTDAIERGDAMITIDGAGLQPHLEAFMFEVLEAIQVRVNQEGLEVLFP